MEDVAKIADADQILSQRLHHALTAGRDELFPILQGQPVEVLLAAVRNPAFDEHHLLALLKQRNLPQAVFPACQPGDTVTYCFNTVAATQHLRVAENLPDPGYYSRSTPLG
jgi:hypothetical protein